MWLKRVEVPLNLKMDRLLFYTRPMQSWVGCLWVKGRINYKDVLWHMIKPIN